MVTHGGTYVNDVTGVTAYASYMKRRDTLEQK